MVDHGVCLPPQGEGEGRGGKGKENEQKMELRGEGEGGEIGEFVEGGIFAQRGAF